MSTTTTATTTLSATAAATAVQVTCPQGQFQHEGQQRQSLEGGEFEVNSDKEDEENPSNGEIFDIIFY